MKLEQKALKGSGIEHWVDREILASSRGRQIMQDRKHLPAFACAGRDSEEIAHIRILDSENNPRRLEQVVGNFGEFRLRDACVIAVQAEKSPAKAGDSSGTRH